MGPLPGAADAGQPSLHPELDLLALEPAPRQLGAPGTGVRNRAFVFASYERNDQDGVVSMQPGSPEFAPLGGIFPSPYRGNQASLRVDVPLGRTAMFARNSFDGNTAFAPLNPSTRPTSSI